MTEHLLRKGPEVTTLSVRTDKTLAEATSTEGPVAYGLDPRYRLRVVRFLIERGLTQPYEGEREEELARIKNFCDGVVLGALGGPSERLSMMGSTSLHVPGDIVKPKGSLLPGFSPPRAY